MSNLTLLFKLMGREFQFKVITSILAIYQYRDAHKNLKIEIFPTDAPLNNHKALITILPLQPSNYNFILNFSMAY